MHDDGEKKILDWVVPAGLGKGDLDRVLDIVSLHPSTAKHIATKLCIRFIADEPPQDAVSTVAASFQRSGGDICRILHTLFQTDQFQDNRGNKFKRPFNFLVSSLRATGATINQTNDSWHLDHHPLGKYFLRIGRCPFSISNTRWLSARDFTLVVHLALVLGFRLEIKSKRNREHQNR